MKCKEKRTALLEPWTGITTVYSRRHAKCEFGGNWQPKWAALSKGVDGSRSNVEAPGPSCQVLFAARRSVATESWRQYLEFMHPQVGNPAEAVILPTDWNGPHNAEEAHRFALDQKKAVLVCWEAAPQL